MTSKNKKRCWWCESDPLYIDYHDNEWGKPVHDDRKLFEMVLLEGFQAGLSWITILKKRENFRKAFRNFNPKLIAKFTKRDINRLLKDPGIVRNRLKVEGAVKNANAFLAVQRQYGSFDKFIWQFSGNKTLRNPRGLTRRSIPSTSKESDAMSKALKKAGFTFVGSTICYAFMQSIGMVDDHVSGCYLYKKRK